VIIDSLVQRGEFLTAYTPYQPEISQGTLTAIFEFQTMLCQLTGMEVANASMYDGSTALPEAVMMACRATGRSRAVVARSVHPEYREVHRTYARHQGLPIAEAPYDPESGQLDLAALEALVDDATAAVVLQSPNFYGCVEPIAEAAAIAHAKGALLVVVFTEAVSLGLLQPPVDADIVAGELQSFAISPSYGGPYVGVIAAKEKFIRQMPGRLVGQTTDGEGRRAFCLTLATREQHIRREKATSNICTNQALIALMATIFMSVYGRQGLRELAEHNLAKAHYLAGRLEQRGARRRFSGPFFNEFVVDCAGHDPAAINRRLLDHHIIGGLELADPPGGLLLCATEMTRREDIEKLVELW
jgi:glycine dehydrogenase subunit 1